MTLGTKLSSHDNAITPLRLGFAVLVVFGHTFELGGFGPDPWFRIAGATCGEVGVNAFFALSGYLVTQSWLRTRSPADYLWRRGLRILPGFWICLLVTGLGGFPWLWAHAHHLGWAQAVHESTFHRYVWRNALLRIRQPTAGDLFATQPAAGMVNGSLWSLFPEFSCYVGIAAVGAMGWLAPRRHRAFFGAAAGLYLLAATGPLILSHLDGRAHDSAWYLWRVATQGAFFAGGATVCLAAARIPVTALGAGLAALSLGLLSAAGAYPWLAPLLLPYIILQWAALLPAARSWPAVDYSYGLYLYHYPVLQALIFFGWGGHYPGALFGRALVATLPLAAASWHFVEAPALKLKTYRPWDRR